MAKKQTPYYKPIQISGARMRAEKDKQKCMNYELYLLVALAVAVILLSN